MSDCMLNENIIISSEGLHCKRKHISYSNSYYIRLSLAVQTLTDFSHHKRPHWMSSKSSEFYQWLYQ